MRLSNYEDFFGPNVETKLDAFGIDIDGHFTCEVCNCSVYEGSMNLNTKVIVFTCQQGHRNIIGDQ